MDASIHGCQHMPITHVYVHACTHMHTRAAFSLKAQLCPALKTAAQLSELSVRGICLSTGAGSLHQLKLPAQPDVARPKSEGAVLSRACTEQGAKPTRIVQQPCSQDDHQLCCVLDKELAIMQCAGMLEGRLHVCVIGADVVVVFSARCR